MALASFTGAIAPALAVACLSATAAAPARAAVLPAASTPCAAPWSASTAYNGGAEVSENGTNYTANWWTQGDDPATHSGPGGSGQPWAAEGSCGGGSPTPPPPPPPDGGGSCAPAWNADTAYNGGDEVSEDGIDYKANWWTRGDDPAGNSGPAGSGKPWTSEGSCSGGSPVPPSPPSPSPAPPPPSPSPAPPDTPAGFVFSPYKDIGINLNWNTNVMSTKVTGSLIPVVGANSLVSEDLPNMDTITLAFATGTCGSESWAGVPGQAFADANIDALDNAGENYIVSTGGAAGTFHCDDPSGMSAFISRYLSPHMVGVDFDIEGGQTQAQIDNLVSQVAYAEGIYPNLRFSFTLATLAASDGSHAGVNSLGAMVVNAVKSAHLSNYTINLMVMDYGAAGPAVCVVSNGSCDMGQSAIQAAENLEANFGIPASHIELTPMIGVNDVSSEQFTLNDVDTVADYAASHGLAGVHYWSLDRDTPCSATHSRPTCNSVPSTTPLQYTRRFLGDFGSGQ